MKRRHFCKFNSMLIALLVCFGALLPAKTVHADEGYSEGFVMDAETLPDGTIGVLFMRGGSSSAGIVSDGTLRYGIYDPEGSWREQPVISDETFAKEASLAIDGYKAHVAYTTDDNEIAYTCQTDDGWVNKVTFWSKNIGGSGEVSSPDLIITSSGVPKIVYFDTRGAARLRKGLQA